MTPDKAVKGRTRVAVHTHDIDNAVLTSIGFEIVLVITYTKGVCLRSDNIYIITAYIYTRLV